MGKVGGEACLERIVNIAPKWRSKCRNRHRGLQCYASGGDGGSYYARGRRRRGPVFTCVVMVLGRVQPLERQLPVVVHDAAPLSWRLRSCALSHVPREATPKHGDDRAPPPPLLPAPHATLRPLPTSTPLMAKYIFNIAKLKYNRAFYKKINI